MTTVIEILSLYYSKYFKFKKSKALLVLLLVLSCIVSFLESIVLPKMLNNAATKRTVKYVYYLLGMFAIAIPLYYAKGLTELIISTNMSKTSRQQFFTGIVNKYKDSYKEIDIGQHVARIFGTTGTLNFFVRMIFRIAIPCLLTLLLITCYSFFIGYTSISIILLLNLVSIYVIIVTYGKQFLNAKQLQEEYYYKVFDSLGNKYGNLMHTYINSNEKNEKKQIRRDQTEYTNVTINAFMYQNRLGTMLYASVSLFSVITLYCLIKSWSPKNTNNTLMSLLLIIYIIMSLTLVKELPQMINVLGTASGSYDFLKNIMNKNPLKYSHNKMMTGDIELKDVTFGYKRNKPIFNNTCLNIKSGEQIAIVGKSGSGKTTLAKLLLKLHNTYSGTIHISGINIRNINSSHIRSKVIYVNQRTNLINASVIDNMRYGCSKQITNDHVITLLDKYNLQSIFSNLPNDIYEQCISGGNTLSLGMQKIIILTRGMLKSKKANIIILDEPLAGLDAETRKQVINMIYNECKNKTLIIITHDMEIKPLVNRVINIESLK